MTKAPVAENVTPDAVDLAAKILRIKR